MIKKKNYKMSTNFLNYFLLKINKLLYYLICAFRTYRNNIKLYYLKYFKLYKELNGIFYSITKLAFIMQNAIIKKNSSPLPK